MRQNKKKEETKEETKILVFFRENYLNDYIYDALIGHNISKH